jgi:proline iminopeptidase
MKLFTILLLILPAFYCNSQSEGFAFSSDKAPIYYRTFGSGKPLLIINGGPGMNSNGFVTLAKKLGESYYTIIYDQRGTGKSLLKTLDNQSITLKLMIDDIERLRTHLHIESWSVLGHSFGGMLASYYATQFPNRIDHLILSSSGEIDLELLNYVSASINSKLSKEELASANYWTNKINAGDTSYHAKLERGKALAPAYLYDKQHVPVIAERLTQSNLTVNQLVWEDLRKQLFDCSEKLKTFDKPVLIIQGKQDIIKTETAEKAHKILKKSKLVLLDHCAHYGWLDNEVEYFKQIYSIMNMETTSSN